MTETSLESGNPGKKEQKPHKKNPRFDRFLGLTMPTKIPGTEEDRGLVERFERAKLYDAYKKFRTTLKGINERKNNPEFSEFRSKARILERNLDILNRQFFESQTRVDVQDPELGEHNIPVVTLDLNPPKEGEKDERVPYFIVPTYVANPHQVAFFAESLALQGKKVHVMTYPEKYKMSGSNPEWLERVKQDGTLELYAKLAEKIIEGMNLRSVNLVGTSMGASIVLTMASHPEFAGKINDLVALDPPSLVNKSGKRLLFDFIFREGLPAATNKEQIVKTALSSNRPDLTASMKGVKGVVAPILGRIQVTPEMIKRINPRGKFQVWVGGKSSITGDKARQVLLEAEKQRLAENPDAQQMKLFVIEGGHHQTLFSTLGIASYIVQEKDPEGTIIPIQLEDLASNGAESILREVRVVPPQSQVT